jgi:alcohol dehydrogenase class IV
MAVLGDTQQDTEAYFGVGQVTRLLQRDGKTMLPLVAVQLAASSAAHLTKYANITELASGQKKLIVDDALIPARALFDYALTTSMSRDFTLDGALDGFSHALEVFYGLQGDALAQVWPLATLAMELIIGHAKAACDSPDDLTEREMLGLGTDLGGYCIMRASTNGGHLTSFSLVDLLPHGRACALMNPYYTVFFAPAIEPQLRAVGAIFSAAGYLRSDLARLHGRELGIAVAEAMLALSTDVGYPTTLRQIPGFSDAHIQRALTAAKNPQLASKLQAMPVAMSSDTVDDYMAPILQAASSGDFSLIRNMPADGIRTLL